jgi:predicted outer membrane protein
METFEPQKMMTQLVDFQKSAFDNTYEALLKMQEQSEKVVDVLSSGQINQPADNQNQIETWKNTFKKQQVEFKTAVDSGFEKFKDLCENFEKKAQVSKPKAKAKSGK